VSPWWRERLRVDLAPGGIALTRFRRGWRPAVAQTAAYPVDASGTGWAPALDVLGAALGEPRWQGAAVEVRLSSHFVRFDLLPWTEALATDDERMTHGRVELESVHGARAREWVLRIDDAAPGEPAPLCAIDEALLQGLQALAAQARGTLVSVAPRFVSAFNRQRSQLGGPRAGFAVLEPGRLTLALLQGGRWARLSSVRVPGRPAEALGAELQQAMAVGQVDEPGRLVVAAVGHVEPLPGRIAGWDVVDAQEPLLHPRPGMAARAEAAVS
jgi:hypothetical protein